MWNEFDALARVPILVIRGANSDILSADTVAAMQARHPDMESVDVADQGHVPILDGPDLIGRIADFVARCDGPEKRVATEWQSAAFIESRQAAKGG